MRTISKRKRIWWIQVIVITAFVVSGMTVWAEEPAWDEEIPAEVAEVGPPTFTNAVLLDKPPALTSEKIAELEYWQENTHLPGPMLADEEQAPAYLYDTASAPADGTESVLADKSMAPGDATLLLNVNLNKEIPNERQSNVMESSVGTGGKYVFYTGNWFAARSSNGGQNVDGFNYIDPFKGFSAFCCDQIAIYDDSRNRHFWLRMGLPDSAGENKFKLSVSKNGMIDFWTYTFKSKDLFAGEWFDYPHIQLGTDYLYISWNMFNAAVFWQLSVMLRLPLDEMAAGVGFSYSIFWDAEWFTFVPVQGAKHTMYWASNAPSGPPGTAFRIYRWDEDSNTIEIFDRTLRDSFNYTNRGQALCGSPSGNWANRYDSRILTGARYSIMAANMKIRGRKILGWWWNVGQGGAFPRPYIEAAAFYEDTLEQVSGFQGRPLLWNENICLAYPSATPNKRQDLAIIFHYGSGPQEVPAIGYAIADDFTDAPPGWLVFNVRTSKARPADNVWGDYNTLREFEPTQKLWVGASHYIRKESDCTRCSNPVYFVFGRERDKRSYNRWKKK